MDYPKVWGTEPSGAEEHSQYVPLVPPYLNLACVWLEIVSWWFTGSRESASAAKSPFIMFLGQEQEA